MSAPNLTTQRFPRIPLIGAGLVIAVAIAAVTFTRSTGVGVARTADAPVIAQQDFRFEDRADGSIAVLDARGERLVETIAPGTHGFLRGTLRALARERKLRGIGRELPFTLKGRADGQLTLEDRATGRRVDLVSFGQINADVFARMLASNMPHSRPR